MWLNTGGGSFVSAGRSELASDTSYEAEDGRSLSFTSTAELRYSGFFPEELDEEGMMSFISRVSHRKDVFVNGPHKASSARLFENLLNEAGILEQIGVTEEPTEVTNLDGTKKFVYHAKDEKAYELYRTFSNYLSDTEGSGNEEKEIETLFQIMENYVAARK
jgi:hypothetical protein